LYTTFLRHIFICNEIYKNTIYIHNIFISYISTKLTRPPKGMGGGEGEGSYFAEKCIQCPCFYRQRRICLAICSILTLRSEHSNRYDNKKKEKISHPTNNLLSSDRTQLDYSCSVSQWRPQKVHKHMVLEYTHGLFIT
jgi:hypothetical protein